MEWVELFYTDLPKFIFSGMSVLCLYLLNTVRQRLKEDIDSLDDRINKIDEKIQTSLDSITKQAIESMHHSEKSSRLISEHIKISSEELIKLKSEQNSHAENYAKKIFALEKTIFARINSIENSLKALMPVLHKFREELNILSKDGKDVDKRHKGAS
jgi:hypothetical protein